MTGGWVERLEEESSSIKCAATNFKNKLTLFFLKDMNQLKTNLHSINPNPIDTSINNQQENLHSITNSQSIIPKPIGTGSIQNRCTLHQPNQSTRHQIFFRLETRIWKLSFFDELLSSCHSARSWRRRRRIHVRVINPRPPEVGVTVADGGWVTGKSAFPPSLIRPNGHLFPSEEFIFR